MVENNFRHPNPIRILLMSDIHIGKYSGFSDLWMSTEMETPSVGGKKPSPSDTVEDVNLQEELVSILKDIGPLDLIIIAGDLTSSGSPGEYQRFNDFIEELSEAIDFDKRRILRVPGNHDLNREIWELGIKDAASSEKYRVMSFSDFPYNNTENTPNFIDSDYPAIGHYENDDLEVFQLHSAWNETPNPPHYGEIGEHQLVWIKEMLDQDSEKIRIIMFHHHHKRDSPHPLIPDPSVMVDGIELHNIVKAKGVDLILHGHLHIPFVTTFNETNMVKPYTRICAGSLSVNYVKRSRGRVPNCFHVITIEGRLESNNSLIGFVETFTRRINRKWESSWDDKQIIDPIIYFGRIYSREEIKEKIRTFLEGDEDLKSLPSFQEMPEEFKSCSLTNLNTYIGEVCEEHGFVMYDEYPNTIVLLRKLEDIQ